MNKRFLTIGGGGTAGLPLEETAEGGELGKAQRFAYLLE